MRSTSSFLCVLTLAAFASSASLSAQQATQEQSGHEGTQAARDTRRAPSIAITPDGNLTMNVSRGTLGKVLNEISALAEVQIVVAEPLVNDPVTFKVRDVPVDEGLRQMLAAYDVFYLYSAKDAKTPGSIKTAWVYRRGDGHDLEPVPSGLWASTRELERQLEDPSPEVRSDTYEMLIERQGERGLETVQKGLTDPDETVRLRTLSAAIDADVDIPAQNLEALILDATAQSQSMRVLALQAIQSKPEAEAIALTLRNDPDDMVRDLARQILERLRKPPG